MHRILTSLILLVHSASCYATTAELRGSIQPSHHSKSDDMTSSPSDTIILTQNAAIALSDQDLIKLFDEQTKEPEFINYCREYSDIAPAFEINKRQFFNQGSQSYLLAVLGTSFPNGAHFDSGPSFIGCFHLENGHWVSHVKAIKVDGHSMWGNCDNVKRIEKYGPDQICVCLEGGQGSQGFFSTTAMYYGLTKEYSFELIFEGTTSDNDEGAGGNLDDRYEYEFMRQPNVTYYTLEMKRFSHENLKQRRLIQFNQEKGKYELN